MVKDRRIRITEATFYNRGLGYAETQRGERVFLHMDEFVGERVDPSDLKVGMFLECGRIDFGAHPNPKGYNVIISPNQSAWATAPAPNVYRPLPQPPSTQRAILNKLNVEWAFDLLPLSDTKETLLVEITVKRAGKIQPNVRILGLIVGDEVAIKPAENIETDELGGVNVTQDISKFQSSVSLTIKLDDNGVTRSFLRSWVRPRAEETKRAPVIHPTHLRIFPLSEDVEEGMGIYQVFCTEGNEPDSKSAPGDIQIVSSIDGLLVDGNPISGKVHDIAIGDNGSLLRLELPPGTDKATLLLVLVGTVQTASITLKRAKKEQPKEAVTLESVKDGVRGKIITLTLARAGEATLNWKSKNGLKFRVVNQTTSESREAADLVTKLVGTIQYFVCLVEDVPRNGRLPKFYTEEVAISIDGQPGSIGTFQLAAARDSVA